ncbi:hypothetical protein [Halobaculum gomorrense]|uniref:Uncharacterized protein n=1 Tax=Halobaculum gomorrense TaxID=43928 RepID=A0A1M5JHY3_9EURY|nr:hypothetical protein [Halobaculum gomorrense]SHG40157.1 hypothetical protein SAMN05443636_0115 [Halobaculum gomorrense]
MSAPRLAHRAAASASAAFDGAARIGETVAFWLAALLPLAYLPALASGIASARPLLLAGLVTAHAAALVLGRGHASDASDADDAVGDSAADR